MFHNKIINFLSFHHSHFPRHQGSHAHTNVPVIIVFHDMTLGGDLTGVNYVSESYLLGLEREAFLSLLGEKKTLERIAHTLKTGKPLRN